MLKSLFKTTNDLSALILRMLLSAVFFQYGAQQVLWWLGRLSVVLRREDWRAKPQAVRTSRRSSQIVQSNFGKSLPDNDGHALVPPFRGDMDFALLLGAFWRDNR